MLRQEQMTRFERDELISTYSVVLPLDELIAFCGLGCHLQPARSACFQLLYLTHTDAGKSEEKKILYASVECLAER